MSNCLLIVNESPPRSFSPSGERILHMALANRVFFDEVIVLSLRGSRRHCIQARGKHEVSKVYCTAVNFRRAMPYPLLALFDPIKFMVLCFHGLALSRRFKPAYVIASLPPLESGLCALILARLCNANLLIDIRDDWESALSTQLKRFFPARMFKILAKIAHTIYSSAQTVFVVTPAIASSVIQRGVSTEVVLAPNGADTKVFKSKDRDTRVKTRSKYDLPTDRVIVAYCGSGINPYYRLDQIMLAIKALQESVLQKLFFVFFVYNGIEQLKKLKHQLMISDETIEVRSPLPRRQLAMVLSACDIGLVPFDASPYLMCARSTKIYEYLSSGLYVVGSGPKGGDLDHFLSEDPRLGLFTVPSVSNFAIAFGEIAENSGKYGDDLRSLRHEFIREHYDREKVMMKIVRIIRASSQRKG